VFQVRAQYVGGSPVSCSRLEHERPQARQR
jgi:hypothetical protein